LVSRDQPVQADLRESLDYRDLTVNRANQAGPVRRVCSEQRDRRDKQVRLDIPATPDPQDTPVRLE